MREEGRKGRGAARCDRFGLAAVYRIYPVFVRAGLDVGPRGKTSIAGGHAVYGALEKSWGMRTALCNAEMWGAFNLRRKVGE